MNSPFFLLATLLPAILCADPPKPKPMGKEQLISLYPDTLLTICKDHISSFDPIFTTPGIYLALFENEPPGYTQSIGLLGLLSLSEVPIEELNKCSIFDMNVVDTILNYPALCQRTAHKKKNIVSALFKQNFEISPEKVTIRHCLSNKAFFKSFLGFLKENMQFFVSRPLIQIIAIAKLNSLPPPPETLNEETLASQSSNSSSSQNNETLPNNAIEALSDLNNEAMPCRVIVLPDHFDLTEYEDEFSMNTLFGFLNEPTYLPFLLRLRSVCATDLRADTYSLFLMSNYSRDIESYPTVVKFTNSPPLIFLYHMYPDIFKKYLDAYEPTNIPQFISLTSGIGHLFLRLFDEKARIVIFPYRHSQSRHDILSTGNTLHVYDIDSNSPAEIHMKIFENALLIYSDQERLPHLIIRISPDEILFLEVFSCDNHVETAVPGTIFAIIFGYKFDPSHLKKFLLSLNKNIELMSDALEDYGFSVFEILSSRKNE